MKNLKRSLDIDAPPNEVWRVLTTPELVREWAAAYVDGISIRTSWREGEPIAWKTPDGGTRACGTVAAFRPERLLKFDYADDTRGPFSETFEISEADRGTRLALITGPLAPDALEAMRESAEHAIQEIKSLAEESAVIHRWRRTA